MEYTSATCVIRGLAALSQSHNHATPYLEGEGHDAYDVRTWRNKLNTEVIDGRRTVVLPPSGMSFCIAAAAKYSKRQIPGQGKATWTSKFTSGIIIPGPIPLWIDPETVKGVPVSVNADGVRGSGKRVIRRFPTIPAGWEAEFEVQILDPIITEDVFSEMLTLAGMFIGVGQNRPQNGGFYGRFAVESVKWVDQRIEKRRRAA